MLSRVKRFMKVFKNVQLTVEEENKRIVAKREKELRYLIKKSQRNEWFKK